jgi:hypothetical protein
MARIKHSTKIARQGETAMTFANRFLGLLLFAVLLGFAPSALAVDGVVLINQHTSVAGLPGCPPQTGFLILICQSGSYRLSGNLTVSNVNTTGILITANDVTLDLNGFTISGPVTCTPTFPVQCTATGRGRGVSGTSGKNITVRNGTVRGMGAQGIVLDSNPTTHSMLVEDVHVESNAAAVPGVAIFVRGGVVTHCTVNANAGTGIAGDDGTTISFNTVSFNGGDGITGGLVTNNSITKNGGVGINNSTLALYNSIVGNQGGFALKNVAAFLGNAFVANGNYFTGIGTSLGHNYCDGNVC